MTQGAETTTTDFTYDGLTLLRLQATQAGGVDPTSWQLTYLYDEQGKPYAGVYRSPAASTTPTVFGVVTTDRGDVVALLDAAGSPFAAYRYDAWGNPQGTGNLGTGVWSQSTGLINSTLAAAITMRQPLRYAGYAYDQESSLYYLSARYYDSATRQFTSKDPAKADGEESAYQYAGGDPVGNRDPGGQRTDPITGEEAHDWGMNEWVWPVATKPDWKGRRNSVASWSITRKTWVWDTTWKPIPYHMKAYTFSISQSWQWGNTIWGNHIYGWKPAMASFREGDDLNWFGRKYIYKGVSKNATYYRDVWNYNTHAFTIVRGKVERWKTGLTGLLMYREGTEFPAIELHLRPNGSYKRVRYVIVYNR